MSNIERAILLQEAEYGMESIDKEKTMSDFYHYKHELEPLHTLVQRYAHKGEMIHSGCASITTDGERIERLAAMAEGSIAKPLGTAEFRSFANAKLALRFYVNLFYERVGEELKVAGHSVLLPFKITDADYEIIREKIESKEFLESIDATLGVDGTVVYAEIDMMMIPKLEDKAVPLKVTSQQLLHTEDNHPIVSIFAGEDPIQDAGDFIGTRRFTETLPTAVQSCKIQTNVVALTAISQPAGMEVHKMYVRGDEIDLIKQVLAKGVSDLAKTVVDARRDGVIYDVIFEVASWIDDDGALGWKLMGAAAYKAVVQVGLDLEGGWSEVG